MIRPLPLIALLALLAGCSAKPGPSSSIVTFSGGRAGFCGYVGSDLHFLLVTDGRLGSAGFGASQTVFIGPSWTGSIQASDGSGREIPFKVGRSSIEIAGRKYRLDDGQAFVVSTKGPASGVRQLAITPHEPIKALVESDRRFDL